jgi:C-terminal binding protein
LKKKVVITDYFHNADIEKKIIGKNAEIICLNQPNEKMLSNEIENADVLLVWHTKISKKTLKRLKKCKAIIRYGVGYDDIDINGARLNNIICANTPDYGTAEVADTACSLILNLVRKINFYNSTCKNYKYGWQENVLKANKFNPIKRLNECTLGIIGFGRIGLQVAIRMKIFGLKILYYDPYVNLNKKSFPNFQKISKLNTLIKKCNILSINCNLNNETKNMIDRKFINKLNNNTLLVNTARGKIIKDLDAIFYGLKIKKLAGVGLDVLPKEPPSSNEKLIKEWKKKKNTLEGRIIINPHAAYYSSRSVIEMREKAARNALRVLKGLKPKNIIN